MLVQTGLSQTLRLDPIELRKIVRDEVQEGYAAGVIIKQNGQVVYEEYVGKPDPASDEITSPNTIFMAASITKSLTAMAIVKMIEKGELSLNQAISDFFMDVPEEKSAITIGNLLWHNSGFRHTYASDDIVDRTEAVQIIFQDSLYYPPGKGWSYSGLNYQLLAAIIELSSGESFEHYMQKNVLDKMNMSNCFFFGSTASLSSEHKAASSFPYNEYRNWGWIGGGNLFSTPRDLLNFKEAIFDGSFFEPSTVTNIVEATAKIIDNRLMGLGWFITDHEFGREIWSRGSVDWGHNGVIRYFPESGLTIIIQTNSGEGENPRDTGNRNIGNRLVEYIFNIQ